MNRVVITGYGCISPLANSADETFTALLAGKTGERPIERFDYSQKGCKTSFASQIPDDVDFLSLYPFSEMEKSEVVKLFKKLDRHQRYAFVAAGEAVKMANIQAMDDACLEQVGVNFATGVGGIESLEASAIAADNGKRQKPYSNLQFLPNIAAGYIANHWGFQGPNNSHCTACAASAHSIIDAFNSVAIGESSIMLAGGAEASVTPVGIGSFNAQTALSTKNDLVGEASRPFSDDRAGFVMGEGSACIVLESLDSALKRGATIYAEVVGYGRTGDGKTQGSITAPHPEGDGAKRAMQKAIAMSGRELTDVGYINAHATGTIADSIEINAVRNLFGAHASNISVSSTKSSTGHLLGAAGALEGLITVLSLNHGTLPYTRNLEADKLDDKCLGVSHVIGEPEKKQVTLALSNSFGFGGTNASLAFAPFTK